MGMDIQLKLNKEDFEKLSDIKRNSGDSWNYTVNELLKLGIYVFLLDEQTLNEI